MKVGDLVRHKDYPQSLAMVLQTWGTPTGDRVHPPTIRVEWVVKPTNNEPWVDVLGSVWLEALCK